MELADAIRSNYLFKGMTPAQFDSILSIAQEKTFDGGAVLVRQFDRKSDLMVLLSGGAKIKGFKDEVIAEIGPGSVIGEVSLVDDQPRSATVTAVGSTQVAVFPSANLHGLMDADAGMKAVLMENIARLLAQRLRNANIQLDAAH